MLNALIACFLSVGSLLAGPETNELRWFKGNTHVHSWFSDGDSAPDVVVSWYKEHGYHFLALTDHNTISRRSHWVVVSDGKRKRGMEPYEKAFPADWIEKRIRQKDGAAVTDCRLKPVGELQSLFNEAGQFILMRGEEISSGFKNEKGRTLPVHLCAINHQETVDKQGGGSVREVLQNSIAAVLTQQQAYETPMLVHVNHPNFGNGIKVEDIVDLETAGFFEVHNGHPGVKNYGDEQTISTERLWDLVLTRRLGELNLPILYGVATDDAHNFTNIGHGANPGRGWVVVRARHLTAEQIIGAMKRGDFYASTGVTLKDIRSERNELTIEIDPQPGVQYTIRFIGTLAGAKGDDEIGQVLKEQAGVTASYKMTGKELYVRAKVISTADHPNPFLKGDKQVAWTQPVTPTTMGAR